MKAIKTKGLNFSMEDFENGLMLAGYVTPSSITELEERRLLEIYEQELDREKPNIYFKRVTLAAEIAWQLHSERTLGRVKFQKLVYLCEHAANMRLQERYSKQAAGPFDHKFMHSIDKEFKKQKWFDVKKTTENNFIRYTYHPLENLENYKKYYDSYFKASNDKIQHIINLFRSRKTDETEIAATIYACLIELSSDGKEINKKVLLELFYNWSDKKSRFTESQVIRIWEWMGEKGIVPNF
ncbi:MAG: hypothetical protein IPI46_08125 [Bacteroidetes bacterium]|nr:hypothetical protein [Bacteroidota bacterium]